MGLKQFEDERKELKKWQKFFDDNNISYSEGDTLRIFLSLLIREIDSSDDTRHNVLISELKKPNNQILITDTGKIYNRFNRFLDDTFHLVI